MSDYAVTFVFEDGRVAAIRAGAQETVYGAALRQKVRLESDCLEGACATCKGHCIEGQFSLDDYSDEALTREEADDGHVLCCRMKVRSDCVIELPYDSALALKGHEPAKMNAKVTAVDEVAAGVYRLDVEAPPMRFLAGQYVHLSVPGTDAVRDYSFANAPGAEGPYRFYVKVLERGAMSEYVSGRARPGDDITMTGPFGQFYLRPLKRPALMVAGGTGLAPMLSMLEHAARTGGSEHGIRLLYGANKVDELFAQQQLDELATRLPLGVTRATVDVQGHVTELLETAQLNGGDCDLYLCGPPPMIDAATRWLHAQGLDAKRIHAERFLPS
jgi:benzoate/toluate 1,2-dioxygenase reductase component